MVFTVREPHGPVQGRSRKASEIRSKSGTPPEPDFSAFWADLGVHLGAQLGQFSLIFQGLFFDPIFEQIFGEKAVTVAAKPGLGWGGGFLAGDPFTGFYWQVRLVRLAAGFQPGAADLKAQAPHRHRALN